MASFLCVAKLLAEVNIVTSLRNAVLFDRVTLAFDLPTSYLLTLATYGEIWCKK